MSSPQRTPAQLAAQALEARVVRMLDNGASVRRVAEETRLSESGVRQILQREKERRQTERIARRDRTQLRQVPPPELPPPVAQPVTQPAERVTHTPPPSAAADLPDLRMVRVADCFADDTYQRERNLRWVLGKARIYDPRLLGVIEVSERDDGRLAIIDGQHRWELVRHIDPAGEEALLRAHIHRGLTVREEAALYRRIDAGRRQLSGWDRWKARRAEGDRSVLAIDTVLGRYGLRTVATGNGSKGAITSTKVCEQVVALGGVPLLDTTCNVIVSGLGPDVNADFALIGGVALIRHHLRHVPAGHLVEALARTDVFLLRAEARAYRTQVPGPLPNLTAAVILRMVREDPSAVTGKMVRLPALAAHPEDRED